MVPVGEDQIQHIELTRDIARWFNNKYKVDYFAEVKPLITESARVMSLVSPENKMSKSLGDKHWVGIDESSLDILSKFKKAVSTPEGIDNLRKIYEAFEENMDGEFNADKMGDTKNIIAVGIAKHFEEFRKRKVELLKDRDYINRVLEDGKKRASEIASKTIKEVKEIIGLK